VSPDLTALREDLALPGSDVGPVLSCAFFWFAAIWAAVDIRKASLNGNGPRMQDPTSGASLPETSMRVRENELSTCGKDREVAGTIGESDIFIACHRLAKLIADGKKRPSAPRLTRILLDPSRHAV
jgi:hypothetical protein